MELFTCTGISDTEMESSIRIRSIGKCQFGIVEMNFLLCYWLHSHLYTILKFSLLFLTNIIYSGIIFILFTVYPHLYNSDSFLLYTWLVVLLEINQDRTWSVVKQMRDVYSYWVCIDLGRPVCCYVIKNTCILIGNRAHRTEAGKRASLLYNDSMILYVYYHHGLALLTLSWDKNWDSHSPMNGYPSFYPRIALVAPSPGG